MYVEMTAVNEQKNHHLILRENHTGEGDLSIYLKARQIGVSTTTIF